MKRLLFLLFVLTFSAGIVSASPQPERKQIKHIEEGVKFSSPDGHLTAWVGTDRGELFYKLHYDDLTIIDKSHIGLKLSDGKTLGKNIKNLKSGKPSAFSDRTETVFAFDKWQVRFWLFDDGMAYRFETSMRDSLTITDEIAEFRLAGDRKAYLAQADSRVKSDDLRQLAFCSFSNTYTYDNVSAFDAKHLWLSPGLIEVNDNLRLLISDYNVLDYPGMFLLPTAGNGLKGYFVPVPKQEHQGGHNNLQMIVDDWHPYIARVGGKHIFPWKMLLVTDEKGLLTTSTPGKLAEPSRLKDVSWVRPGKVAWDWWNSWNITGTDFKAGINNDTYKYYIDFASQLGIEYVILDEGWAVNKKADLMQVVPEINLPELVEYAAEKDVGIVLWAGYKAFERDMEGVCRHYSQMGVKGFKIDFMDRNDQPMMNFLARAAEMCAKYHLFCDFHGVPTPNGFTVTYPNTLNFEAVAGLEMVKWSSFDDFDEVRHETILPFIRQVVGPMDYTQGAMRNAIKKNYYPCYTQPMSQGTRCRQMALYVIFNSPLNMLCDSPSAYQKEENYDCARFMAEIPVVWDETRVLHAELGKCVVIARRKGKTWYVGGITNWDARDITLDLSFTGGASAAVWFDGKNADRNGEDHKVESWFADRPMTIHMAPGGGFAILVE